VDQRLLREFSRELAAHGWIGMTWPVEFGGGGRPADRAADRGEEMISAGAPIAASWLPIGRWARR
jgi:alkylation response protein AidB-like acyl-CoA dehydrogenase